MRREAEEARELHHKVFEEEVGVNTGLDFLWQLVKDLLILVYNYILVVLPSVSKVRLDAVSQLLANWLVLIEHLQLAEEAREVVSLIQVAIQLLELLQDLNEVSHHIREDSYAEQQ